MKSSLYAFLALLLMIGVAAPALAKAQSLKLNPTSLNFGNVVVGTTSPAQTLFATNVSYSGRGNHGDCRINT
jgi:hypothetical protein